MDGRTTYFLRDEEKLVVIVWHFLDPAENMRTQTQTLRLQIGEGLDIVQRGNEDKRRRVQTLI